MSAPSGDPAPAQANRWFEEGNAAFRRGDMAGAASAYEHAVALAPAHADAWLNLGAAYRWLERATDAADCARRVLKLRPDDPRALNNLANALNMQGRFKEAALCYWRALEIRPDDAEAWYNLVNQDPLNDGSPESETFFRRLAGLVGTLDRFPVREQVALLFALGKVLDARGDADRAFECFAHGNELHRSTLRFDIARAEARATAIAERFDSSLLDRLAGAGSPSERPIFVIGMPRSATTLVEQIISAHPEVHGAGEINLFGALASRMSGQLSESGLQDLAGGYLDATGRLGPGKARLTDKSISSFELIGLIHLCLPNARIIHCRRNMKDVCVSCFTTRFSGGHDYAYDLAELGRYARLHERLMAHWRQVLPPGRIFEVEYEALVEDLESGARGLIDHLGLGWNEACLKFHESGRNVGTASFAQVRRPIYKDSVGRWRRFAPHLGPLLGALDAPA